MSGGLVVPVIMCGGGDMRLWPASRDSVPKQFINLLGTRSSFQETALRVAGTEQFAPPVIVTSHAYGFIVADQLAELGMAADILLEPARRDSGPAITAATSFVAERQPDALVLVLAADHVVRDLPAFHAAVDRACAAAAAGAIVTFGVTPDRPATGYGYIRRGTELAVPDVFAVEAFVEKPDEATARRYVDEGCLWNSGNLLFRADTLLAEYERFDAQTLAACRRAVAAAGEDLGCVALDAAAFRGAATLSIDFAVIEEKSDRVAVVPAPIGWSDVGSWHAVWELLDKDADDNAATGDAVFLDARNNLAIGDRLVCLAGVDGLAVIATQDATLVVDRAQSEAVRALVERLKADGRPEVADRLETFRPWGSYERLDLGERFQVKRIVVKPRGRLSLQKHYHRAEHWIVVRDTALVTVGDRQQLLHENESTYIPLGEVHRLENPGTIPLELIEVQSGSYLGEDDIVRLEDVYNRT